MLKILKMNQEILQLILTNVLIEESTQLFSSDTIAIDHIIQSFCERTMQISLIEHYEIRKRNLPALKNAVN